MHAHHADLVGIVAPLSVADTERAAQVWRQRAEALVELLGSGDVGGIHHVVNSGSASRATWARELFTRVGLEVEIDEVPASTWARASTPPAWGVLDPTPLPGGEPLRSWPDALADYVPTLLRQRAAGAAASEAPR